MDSIDTGGLVERLIAAEQQIVAAREVIIALQNVVNRGKRSRWIPQVILLVAIAMVLVWNHSTTVSAQGGWLNPGGTVFTAPLKVVADDGSPIFEISAGKKTGGRNLILYNPQGQPSVIAVALPEGPGFLAVTDGAGAGGAHNKVAMAVDNNGGVFAVNDEQGRPIADILKGPNGNQGLSVYEPAAGTEVVQLMGKHDGGGQISLHDESVKAAGRNAAPFFVGTSGSDTYLGMFDLQGNKILQIQGSATADENDSNAKAAANAVRGIQIYNTDGEKVGGFVAGGGKDKTGEGGGAYMWVGMPGGTAGAAMLSLNKDGVPGLILSKNGKTPEVTLSSKDGLTLWEGNADQAAALLTWGKVGGLLAIGNGKGQDVVEAGVTTDGRGLVKTGPFSGGQVGLQGLPTAIMGRNK